MNSPSVAVLSLIMLLAGIGIPVMAALNGGLGVRLGNPVQAATLLFALAFCVSVGVLIVHPKPIAYNLQVIPIRFYLGGLFVAFYVLSVTFIAPKLGVGNAIILVLLGQTLASAAIDHFGWFGVQQTSLTPARGLGLVIMIGPILTKSVFRRGHDGVECIRTPSAEGADPQDQRSPGKGKVHRLTPC